MRPRLLEPGEVCPPGCTVELRAAIVAGPERDEPAAGPYTRAQFAAAVDEAHAAALHEIETIVFSDDAAWWSKAKVMQIIERAHKALHGVGAGLPRVDCGTNDPEAQRIVRDLIAAAEREIPCGHKVADLIGGTDPATGRPLVTKCGACLHERQPEIREQNRRRAEVSPQGRTTQGVAEAVGAAALDLLAKHGAEGHVLEVRLVRREGGTLPCDCPIPSRGVDRDAGPCRACGGLVARMGES